jgi:aminoglycoside phosphotransferase
VLYSKVNESYRWCLVEFDKNKKIGKFIEKPLTYDKEAFALIGVYGVSDVALFRKCVNGLLGESMKKTPSLQLQVSHLLERYMQHLPIKALPLKEWFDCGNVDNLITSREKLLESRAFNEISVDDLSGIITKYSKEKDKFVDEIQYYQLLPADIQIFFPRIIDYKISGDKPCLKMEYYGYPSLSELFIYGNLHFAVWAQVFNHLKRILEIFNKYQVPAKKESFHYMYVEKTHERLDKLRGQPEFKDGFLKYNNIKLNSRPIKNIDLIWPEITKLIFALKEDNFTIIHGDLCFSNILYNVESRICKLIDPRGSFGEKGIFGDTKYDIAKLYHSVCGNYDFITNDLFEIKINGAAVELDIFCDTYHENVRKLFKEIILREYDEAKIKLINGLLFISMCPLHYEEPKRQLAMFVIGLNYLNEVLNSSSL